MNRTLVRELESNLEKQIVLKGFVKKVKSFKEFRFVALKDRSGICQIVLPNDLYSQDIKPDDVVEVEGKVIKQSKSPYNGLEIIASGLNFLSRTKEENHLAFACKDKPQLDALLNRRTASLKLDKVQKPFLVQSELMNLFSSYLHENEFIEVKTPKIITASSKGGSALFKVDYFDNAAFLSQSPQFYHQMILGSFERVFEMGPCYRAERYTTTRHVNEFTSLDACISFTNDHFEVMNFLEDMLKQTLPKVGISNTEMPRISYQEAVAVLGKKFGVKLNGNDKQKVGTFVKEKYNCDFVFVYNFPKELTKFYVSCEEGFSKSFSLLYNGQEMGNGYQMVHNYETLIENMRANNINPDDFKYLVDAFKGGLPPHGDFCIGINRLTALLLNLGNIREAILFPRDQQRLTP